MTTTVKTITSCINTGIRPYCSKLEDTYVNMNTNTNMYVKALKKLPAAFLVVAKVLIYRCFFFLIH